MKRVAILVAICKACCVRAVTTLTVPGERCGTNVAAETLVVARSHSLHENFPHVVPRLAFLCHGAGSTWCSTRRL